MPRSVSYIPGPAAAASDAARRRWRRRAISSFVVRATVGGAMTAAADFPANALAAASAWYAPGPGTISFARFRFLVSAALGGGAQVPPNTRGRTNVSSGTGVVRGVKSAVGVGSAATGSQPSPPGVGASPLGTATLSGVLAGVVGSRQVGPWVCGRIALSLGRYVGLYGSGTKYAVGDASSVTPNVPSGCAMTYFPSATVLSPMRAPLTTTRNAISSSRVSLSRFTISPSSGVQTR